MNQPVTVHMVGGAHIDPVWLWGWPKGAIEVLSTCRSAADLLDRYDEFVFCRSDAWVYEIIERHDPHLFGRILDHVKSGRWHAPGGWYIQSDCNLPLAASFRKHIEIGERYFRERFGMKIDVGFNVDSFGHSASLPGLLTKAGYDSYVMMRPMKNEMELPSDLFRWQGDDGSEVVTWRIQKSYNAATPESMQENIEAAVEAAIPSIPHVMCFYGVGDHGGGPTSQLIEWIRNNQDRTPGYHLEFSHPRRFFDKIMGKRESLPLVVGELQMHAVGCFTVVSEIKRRIRRAEHAILRAERASARLGDAGRSATSEDGAPPAARPVAPPVAQPDTLASAWRTVLFNQFHDIAGGSSVEEACDGAVEQLGGAISAADSETYARCFDHLVSLPPNSLQRMVVYRFGDTDYAGPLYHEPWIHPSGFYSAFGGALLDESDNELDYQIVRQSAILGPQRAIVWDASIPRGEERTFRLDPGRKPRDAQTDLRSSGSSAIENSNCSVEVGTGDLLFSIEGRGESVSTFPGSQLSVGVFEDTSDTWSHGLSGFRGPELGRFVVTRSNLRDEGPIRSSVELEAAYGNSRISARCSIYRNCPWIDLDLELHFLERNTIVKLMVPVIESAWRSDGIATGQLRRPQNGNECPLLDWTCVPIKDTAADDRAGTRPIGVDTSTSDAFDSQGFGVVSPDCFAFDGSSRMLRFSLVRSPAYAWDRGTKFPDELIHRHTDQGLHRFRFRLVPGAKPELLARHADWMHQPPLILDWTRGM